MSFIKDCHIIVSTDVVDDGDDDDDDDVGASTGDGGQTFYFWT